jgi:hypothetical protein
VERPGGWGIEVGSYDPTQPLVIDPLVYSTYIGGSEWDVGYAIAVNASGNAYVTGETFSPNYDWMPGAFQMTLAGWMDAFVTKLNAAGTALVYSTYLGGSDADGGYAIAVDGSGNAYVTGWTSSSDYPTVSAYQSGIEGWVDVFVTKLNATGDQLLYSTYLGGSFEEYGYGIAVDGSGNAYVTGYTYSFDYDVTVGAYQTTHGGLWDVFVTKLNATGNLLLYSTYLGGSGTEVGRGIAVDGSGNAYVTGYTYSSNYPVTVGAAYQTTHGGGADVFVTKLNAIGDQLLYSTYIGGVSDDAGYGIALDGSGHAYVTGYTSSLNYPTTPGAFQPRKSTNSLFEWDVFVTKLNATGTDLVYSTFLGGDGNDVGYGIALDGSGHAYVTGHTWSSNYPVTPGALQPTNGGGMDVFVTKLNKTGTALVYSTYIGDWSEDNGRAIAVDGSGHAYVTGYTWSSNYPTTAGAFQQNNDGWADAFVTKVCHPITLTSAPGTDDQTVCVNTPIIDITYSTSGVTGASASGLPNGVGLNFSGGELTISGTPMQAGIFNYTVTLTGGCAGVTTVSGTITVQPDNTITLTSAAGTDDQTVCVNTAITPITYSTTGATGATVMNLPRGLSSNFDPSDGVITISGAPVEEGPFTYTVILTGGCGNVTATGTITVRPSTAVTLTSAPGTNNQTVCENTPITPITYSTIGASSATVSGLPRGLSSNFDPSDGVITISGTPSDTGTFNYTVEVTGPCGDVTATGTIIVRPNTAITRTSAAGTDSQTVCVNTAITPITYSATGAEEVRVTGLPRGVTSTLSNGNITISGAPEVVGTFYYVVIVTGPCGGLKTATGTIIVQPNTAITRTSAAGTDSQTVCVNTPITPITYRITNATGATSANLPPGVTGIFLGGDFIILGTPTDTGTFNYTVTVTGGCGNVTATGRLVVNACQSSSLVGGGVGGPTWRVYPNPTSGSFVIESSEDGTFELINELGQVVQVYEVRGGRAEVQATLSAGVYYLREQRSGTVQRVVILE